MDSISCLFHPHHASLMDPPRSLRSLLLHPADPYYAIDGHSHRGLVAPRFDVDETDKAYFLEGELPGIKEKRSIAVEWLANKTLIVRGRISTEDIESEWGVTNLESPDHHKTAQGKKPHDHHQEVVIEQTPPEPEAEKEKEKQKPPKPKEPKHWLTERRRGDFERSFTFAIEVDPHGMKAKLEHGLLKVMVPKKEGDHQSLHKVPVE